MRCSRCLLEAQKTLEQSLFDKAWNVFGEEGVKASWYGSISFVTGFGWSGNV